MKTHPVVFLNGARQTGKSTLVQMLSKHSLSADYVSFDSPLQIAAAVDAPESFLKRESVLIIDEVQLVPEIFRSLKIIVDELRQENRDVKGRFLLTGSANILALPRLSDALVGRMGILPLYSLSASEVMSGKGDFIERLFTGNFSKRITEQSLTDVIQQATYPEISNASKMERNIWFDSYLTTILQRDVRALAEIEKLSILPNLLRLLATRAGALMNDTEIARDAGLNSVTTKNYKTLLKMLFLSFELAPWYRNIGKRLVKSSKGYIADTSLLCYLLQYDIEDCAKNKPELFGHILENFVATELMKLLSFQMDKMSLYHFRTSDQKEVDFVLEKTDGTLYGIEVKTSEYVNASDFKGLKELKKAVGDDFVNGIVLYRGKDVVPFGDNLWAVPVDNLWL
ncbi:MAG: ATP-binding protein [Flavobacteriales bacterium]|nr:ATP-binding protein [Flavobacteriales bacterium]